MQRHRPGAADGGVGRGVSLIAHLTEVERKPANHRPTAMDYICSDINRTP